MPGWYHMVWHHSDDATHIMAHQVIRSPDALAALVAQLDVPARGQQDGQGRLHAHRAELRPVLLIRGDKAAPSASDGAGTWHDDYAVG